MLEQVLYLRYYLVKRVLMFQDEDVILHGEKSFTVCVDICVGVLNVDWGICETEIKTLSHYTQRLNINK